MLYFENLSGVKEDEYLRDGITEDIITELSKIKGLKIFSRPTVLAYRDKPVTPAQIGQQLGAAYVLAGSLRRAGNRLRINAQLVDTQTDFPLWSERYDREMQDVFEVQDEIARKIAEALRITLTPQEQEALAAKPTENLQAYDLYLRGKSYARRLTRQDLEFALQMFENAVSLGPELRAGPRRDRQRLRAVPLQLRARATWMDARPRPPASARARCSRTLPEVQVAEAWILYAEGKYDEAVRCVRQAIERKRDCEGAYYLLLPRAVRRRPLPGGRRTSPRRRSRRAATDYNVYVPIINALGALGKKEALANVRQRRIQALEAPPEEGPRGCARARAPGGRLRASRPRRGRRCARRTSRWRCAPTRRRCSTTPPASSASSARRPRRWTPSRRRGTPASGTRLGAPRPRPRAAARRAGVRAAVPGDGIASAPSPGDGRGLG